MGHGIKNPYEKQDTNPYKLKSRKATVLCSFRGRPQDMKSAAAAQPQLEKCFFFKKDQKILQKKKDIKLHRPCFPRFQGGCCSPAAPAPSPCPALRAAAAAAAEPPEQRPRCPQGPAGHGRGSAAPSNSDFTLFQEN